jgi:DNA polymerase-3 subunit delta'
LLCKETSDTALASCGKCQSCILFSAGNHPDLLQVRKPADKSSLPIELFIGKNEKRNQEGLCHEISLRPMVSGRRVAIIDDADDFNEASANCLLKTLEEPPKHSLIILLGTSLAKQLPTIRSRSQVVRFARLSLEDVVAVLGGIDPSCNADSIQRLAQRSDGSVEAAIAARDEALWMFRDQFLKELSTRGLNDVRLAKLLEEFVKEAGKDAPPRRLRLRQVIGFATELFRGRIQTSLTGGIPAVYDRELSQSLERLADDHVPVESAILALQTCLDAEEHVLRNANQASLIQWWLAELAGILAPRRRIVRDSPV